MVSNRRALVALAGIVGLALAASGLWLVPSSAFTPTVATTTVAGQQVVGGEVPKSVKTAEFDVSGTASTVPPLSVDAGDSTFTRVGEVAALEAIASSGTAPYSYLWTLNGSSTRFAPGDQAKAFLDTTGLEPGVATVQVVVTDQKGATAADTVKVALWAPVVDVLLDESVAVGPGVPDEPQLEGAPDTSGAIDGETHRFGFTVAPHTSDLGLELSWTTHEPDPVGIAPVTLNDFDLYVDDPSDAEDDNVTGATAAQPEQISIEDPAIGDWTAQVNAFANTDDTFRLKVTSTVAAPDPLPKIATASPFRFAPGEPQRLTATAAGTAPLAMQWDLDLDGSWDATGNEVIAAYPLGTHLAVVKVTDGNGFEERQMVGVRVVEPTATVAPMVVVAVNDTGVNLYHDDFNARAFPDPAVLAATDNFTKHPSEYIPGFPADMPALPITHGAGYHPAQDHALVRRSRRRGHRVGAGDEGDRRPRRW